MEIRVTCDTKDSVNLDDLRVIQGQLKALSEENFAKLKNQIIDEGFSFPCFVWEHNGLYNLLDGTHRYLTLVKLKQEGYEIPLIPVVKIEARDLSHAKKKLLAVTSSYAKITDDGLYEFLNDVEWPIDDLGDFELEGINKDMFVDKFFKDDQDLTLPEDAPADTATKTCKHCGGEL